MQGTNVVGILSNDRAGCRPSLPLGGFFGGFVSLTFKLVDGASDHCRDLLLPA